MQVVQLTEDRFEVTLTADELAEFQEYKKVLKRFCAQEVSAQFVADTGYSSKVFDTYPEAKKWFLKKCKEDYAQFGNDWLMFNHAHVSRKLLGLEISVCEVG